MIFRLISALIAALSSVASVVATIFIVRLTARYARSADKQADAADVQARIAARSIEALELQMHDTNASRSAAAVTAAVAVAVTSRVWLRLIERDAIPRRARLIPTALLQASLVTVQISPVDAHRLRRIFEALMETEADAELLQEADRQDARLLAEIREKIRQQFRTTHAEAIEILRSLAPEHAEELFEELKIAPS